MLKNTLLYREEHSIEEILQLLDDNGNGVLAVVDGANRLIGIITDGDVRRGILHKKSVREMINFNPKSINVSLTRSQSIDRLKSLKTRHLPIVDDQNCLVDILIADELELVHNDNVVVIMAGGLGTRLGQLTKNTPKPMLHVGRKPLLEDMINLLKEQGFYNFYISVNYKADLIKEYFQDGSRFGVSIQYLHEKKRLGTGGAISLIKKSITDPFFVINGDIITTMNFNDMLDQHKKQQATITMGIREFLIQNPYGTVNIDDSIITSFEEKPVYKSYINAGIYLINPEYIEWIPKDQFYNITELFEQILQKGIRAHTFEIKDYWIDIGQIHDYEQANTDMLAEEQY